MAKYKLGEEEVSESEFKEAVYGYDSKQAKAARREEREDSRDRSRAGSSGSNYAKVTRRDGREELVDLRSGDVVKSEKSVSDDSGTVVVGVKKNDDGSVTAKNIGKNLDEEQKEQVSKMAEERGILSSSLKRDITKNKGRVETKDKVSFSYAHNEKKSVGGDKGGSDVVPASYKRMAAKSFEKDPDAFAVYIDDYKFTRKESGKDARKYAYIGSGARLDPQETPEGFRGFGVRLSREEDKTLQTLERKHARGDSAFVEGAKLFGLGAAQGVYNVVSLLDVKKTDAAIEGFVKSSVKDPSTVLSAAGSVGRSAVRNPVGFIGEVTSSAGLFKGAGAVLKKSSQAYYNPRTKGSSNTGVQTSRSLNNPSDEVMSSSESVVKVKSGADTYRVDVVTDAVDRADDAGSVLRTSRSALQARKTSRAGVASENTVYGLARSDDVINVKNGRVYGRGGTVQATAAEGGYYVKRFDVDTVGSYADDVANYDSYVRSDGRDFVAVSKNRQVSGVGRPSFDDLKMPRKGALRSADVKNTRTVSVERARGEKVASFQGRDSVSKPAGEGAYVDIMGDDVAKAAYNIQGKTRPVRAGDDLVRVNPYEPSAFRPGVVDDAITNANNAGRYKYVLISRGEDVFDVGRAARVADRNKKISAALNERKSGGRVKGSDGSGSASGQQTVQTVKQEAISAFGGVRSAPPETMAREMVSDIVAPKVQQYSQAAGRLSTNANKAGASLAVDGTGSPVTAYASLDVRASPSLDVAAAEVSRSDQVIKSRVFQGSGVAQEQVINTRRSSASAQLPRQSSRSSGVSAVKNAQMKSQVESVAQKNTIQMRQSGGFDAVSPSLRVAIPGFNTPKPPVGSGFTPRDDRRRRPGFVPFVRERGVFRRASGFSFSRVGARDVLAGVLEKTPRASGFIRKTNNPRRSTPRFFAGNFKAFKSSFRRKQGLLVEKEKSRINTEGEKKGITFKGLRSLRLKRTFKGVRK